MKTLLRLSAIAAFLAAPFYALMGIDWLTLYHGLHPAIAFPMAVACLILARAAFNRSV